MSQYCISPVGNVSPCASGLLYSRARRKPFPTHAAKGSSDPGDASTRAKPNSANPDLRSATGGDKLPGPHAAGFHSSPDEGKAARRQQYAALIASELRNALEASMHDDLMEVKAAFARLQATQQQQIALQEQAKVLLLDLSRAQDDLKQDISVLQKSITPSSGEKEPQQQPSRRGVLLAVAGAAAATIGGVYSMNQLSTSPLARKGIQFGACTTTTRETDLAVVLRAHETGAELELLLLCDKAVPDLAAVQELLRQGTTPDVSLQRSGQTPLSLAVRRDQRALVELLLTAGAAVRNVDKRGETPLHKARSAPVVQLLVCAGADIEARDPDGYTPLHVMAEAGRLEAAEALVQAGAVVDSLSQQALLGNGLFTPLQLAAGAGQFETVRMLLRAGASPNHADLWGRTPLHSAARWDHPDIVRLLLTAGADRTIISKFGRTPRDEASNLNMKLMLD